MAKARNIRELTAYMMATRSAVVKGHAAAVIEMTQRAEQIAKANVKKNFPGRGGRTLTGRLLNSVFSGFEVNPGLSLPTGFIGTQGTPYGRIHEEGGKITPQKAKHLWVKNYEGDAKNFKRLTPTQWFMLFQKSARDRKSKQNFKFSFTRAGKPWAAGVEEGDDFTPLFFLRDEVNMPARPFIMPAVREATADYAKTVKKHIRSALKARFLT